jgi:hypothetical protein
MFSIYYKKNDNKSLFKEFRDINITKIQNYIPLYNNFFNLNDKNYKNINLNQNYRISSVTKTEDKNIYDCILEHESNKNNNVIKNEKIKSKTFFKFSPLIDPVKFMVGKYDNIIERKNNLPKLNNSNCHSKVLDPNNSAYVDGFFTYLTSNILHHHKFVHGIDFYGSFLGIQKDFKVNIFDDLEYLNESEYFHKNKGTHFKIEDLDEDLFFDADTRNYKKKLNIERNISNKSIYSLTEENFDNLFLESVNTGIVDISKSLIFEYDIKKNNDTASDCSSRSSHTSNESDNEVDISDIDIDDMIEEYNNIKSKINADCSYNDTISSDSYSSGSSTCSDDSDIECMAKIDNFPVQIICLEKMESTLDSLIEENMSEKEWTSCLFQVIISLFTYQKMFNFTHNDLHTNNIMFNKTDKQFLYYKINNKFYKVPTYGKIYKIIDFGRAIYSYRGKLLCSDSFHAKGDAATQYNIEPYLNKHKPRLEPNKSFDLCRLACSLYDYFSEYVDDINNTKNKVAEIINDWCKDDKGRNILYKKCGEERYPDFKLYKMIARTVHNHTPEKQLDKPLFKQYEITKNKIRKKNVMNIDSLPIYV